MYWGPCLFNCHLFFRGARLAYTMLETMRTSTKKKMEKRVHSISIVMLDSPVISLHITKIVSMNSARSSQVGELQWMFLSCLLYSSIHFPLSCTFRVKDSFTIFPALQRRASTHSWYAEGLSCITQTEHWDVASCG